jgi:hypothetical protein
MWTKPFPTFAMLLSIGSALCPAISSASPPCAGLPNVVFIAGSIAADPLVRPIAQSLARDDMNKATIAWQLTSSCSGVEALVKDTLPTSCATGACITGQAMFWGADPRDTTVSLCDLDAKGQKVDLTVSDVAPIMCPGIGGTAPTGIIDVLGPVSAYGMVMATQAGETAIQAEEAHFVFGQGKSAGVTPWQNDQTITLLGNNDAGQILVGLQIKLPPARWMGMPAATPADVVTTIYGDPASGIGILPTSLIDPQRNQIKVLAFQAIKQRGAFYPDRKATTFEKQNVRDGHYPLWGYLHMILRATPGNPTQALSELGSRVAQLLMGQVPVAGLDTVSLQVKAGLIPQCAMKVIRDSDTSPLTLLDTAEPCHCWFEQNVTNGTLNCQACADGKTCATGKCRRNLCEVQ